MCWLSRFASRADRRLYPLPGNLSDRLIPTINWSFCFSTSCSGNKGWRSIDVGLGCRGFLRKVDSGGENTEGMERYGKRIFLD